MPDLIPVGTIVTVTDFDDTYIGKVVGYDMYRTKYEVGPIIFDGGDLYADGGSWAFFRQVAVYQAGGDLRGQLAATLYEVANSKPWGRADDEEWAETRRLIEPLVGVFAEWLTIVPNQEVLIAHQRTEAGCLCGCAKWGEHHSGHVLAKLAETLGGES